MKQIIFHEADNQFENWNICINTTPHDYKFIKRQYAKAL